MEMSEFLNRPIEDLIRPEGFSCACGKRHTAFVRYLKLGRGAVDLVPDALKALGSTHPMVVCGPYGYEAAGKRVCALLEENAIAYTLCVIPGGEHSRIKPAEQAAGYTLLRFDHDCDLILGVGSGVINDLCKVLGKTACRPCMIVATAPSMDGYASDSASMEIGNIKHSLGEQIPAAILCDTEILAAAPMHMLHAGLGDILAKFTSLCDWKVSSIVTGEYYCDDVAALVRSSLMKAAGGAAGVKERQEASIRAVTEGLLLSGLTISYAGTSHPASGLEHYFSHCWEMMRLERGQEYELHGIQVGIGTLLTIRIIEWLKTIRPDMRRAITAADSFDGAAWERNLRRVFPKAADGLVALERTAGKNGREERLRRAEQIAASWDTLMAVFESVPPYGEVETLMRKVGMPARPEEIGLSPQDVADAFVCSRDIRNKYLLSSLIWDIGYMDEFAERIGKE